MKNIIKMISVLLLVVTYSCEENDGRFGDFDPESGWVQFNSSSTTFFSEDLVADETTSITVPVTLTAPINSQDLTVTYDIVDVVGNSSSVITTPGSIVFAAGTNTPLQPLTLNINLNELQNNIFQDYSFDVVLTGTSNNLVKVGIQGDASFPTILRVNLSAPCMTPMIGGTLDAVSSNLQSGPGGGCPNGDGSTTTTVTWTEISEGLYSLSDASFGQFAFCWGDAPASGIQISLLCNELSTTGTDQYGDAYTYTIVDISGADLTMDWENTYGDGGSVVLTRQDGQNWPVLVN